MKDDDHWLFRAILNGTSCSVLLASIGYYLFVR